MKLFTAVTFAALFFGTVLGQGYTPSKGFVPDEATAVRVAEAVLIPVYGVKQIESERPFRAKLKKGVWTVEGTLRCSDGKGGFTTDCVGGVATVQISKHDARIISMIHYK
jgi:hypothetical protein